MAHNFFNFIYRHGFFWNYCSLLDGGLPQLRPFWFSSRLHYRFFKIHFKSFENSSSNKNYTLRLIITQMNQPDKPSKLQKKQYICRYLGVVENDSGMAMIQIGNICRLRDRSKFTGYLGRVLGKICLKKSLRPPYFSRKKNLRPPYFFEKKSSSPLFHFFQ